MSENETTERIARNTLLHLSSESRTASRILAKVHSSEQTPSINTDLQAPAKRMPRFLFALCSFLCEMFNVGRNLTRTIGLAIFLSLVVLVAFVRGQHRGVSPESCDPQAIEAGSKLFGGSCSVCHGIDGRGSARGPDLTQGLVVTRGSDDEVFQVIRQGVPGTSMAGFDWPDPKIRQLVAFIRSLSTKAAQLAVPGNPDSGKHIFFAKGRCADCHMIRGQGGLLGPELSNLGGERTLSEIRQSILKPGSSLQRRYKTITVVTQSGDKITGTLRNRDNFSLQMIDQQGNLRFFLTDELHTVVLQEESLMPENYESLLSTEELQDLLAYLSRQTVSGGVEK
jgi:putative heme-binding domain-containing protein